MGNRRLWRSFCLLLVASVTSYLWLGGYAHPVADDYCYAAKSRGMGLWEWSFSEWLTWNGRYASNLLMIHGPLTWWSDPLIGYRLMPPLLLGLTFLSMWFLLRRASRRALSTAQELLGALVFLLLYLVLMPDLGEGFYWYTGAVTYQLGSILLLVHLGLLAHGQGRPLPRMAAMLLNLLLAFVITGMNEIHMVLMLCLHTVLTVWQLGKKKPVAPALLFLSASLAGALLMYLAPGNAVRASMFADTHRLGYSLGMSLLQAVRFTGTWLLSPALLAFGVLYIPIHKTLRERIPGYVALLQLPPWAAVLLPFLLVGATTFPAYWNTGLLGQHRTVNVACLFFIPLFFLNVAIWLERGVLQPTAAWDPTRTQLGLAMALALTALHLTGNGIAVHADLLGGRAGAYDRVMTQRENQLRASAANPEAMVLFTPQTQPPRSLPSYEGQYLLREWMMHCQARFFGAAEHQVRLKGQTP
ncbi:MAG: hypothetical protein IT230_06995 [Flavobacteriales bacterium]|nr:hypothetical protein [Flavobacteriales bacterium]